MKRIISKVARVMPLVNKAKSIYDLGKKIKNHIYTRRNFMLLLKKHSVMLKQLKRANEILISIDDLEAKKYCQEYALPRGEGGN